MKSKVPTTMKQLKHILLLLTLTCMGVLLQNCRRDVNCGDDDDTVTDYKIDKDEFQKIPYTGFESLTFVRTTVGDTHTFVGDGWKQYWGLTTTRDDCPQKERYEMKQLVFSSTTFPKPITISIYIDDVSKWTLLDVDFQNKIFEEGTAAIRKPYDIDTLNILGTDYSGIEFLSDLDSSYKCYYNVEHGIVRLFFKNGETWDLLKQ